MLLRRAIALSSGGDDDDIDPHAMPLGNRSIRRQKTLGMAGRFEPLHATLPLARRPMRVFTAVIQIATLSVFDARQQLALRGAIALEFVCGDHAWHIHQALEELTEKLLRRRA